MNIAQSNRSFEVWLYYHFFETAPIENIENWKQHLNQCIPGGFNFRNHPEKVEKAIEHAKKNYVEDDYQQPSMNNTNVFNLVHLILEKLKNA
ncbi:MAG: RloB domain-containing protein [Bacteroidetes bacterium]|nr:RloB domain-containing protein [Bacteroidota bacterium]